MSDAASNKKTFLGVDSQLFASSLLIIFAAFAGGVIGILTLIVLFFFTKLEFGTESKNKHGIANKRLSRLGGIALLFSVSLYYLSIPLFYKNLEEEMSFSNLPNYIWLALGIAFVAGNILVPNPATGMTAFVIFFTLQLNYFINS